MFAGLFAALGYAVSGIFGALGSFFMPSPPIQTHFINQPDAQHSYFDAGYQTNEESSGFGRPAQPEQKVVLGEVGAPITLADVSRKPKPDGKTDAKKPDDENATGQITILGE